MLSLGGQRGPGERTAWHVSGEPRASGERPTPVRHRMGSSGISFWKWQILALRATAQPKEASRTRR